MVKNYSLPWHFELWTRKLSSRRWGLLIPLLPPQDWQLSQRAPGAGWFTCHCRHHGNCQCGIFRRRRSLDVDTSKGKISLNQSSGPHFFLLNVFHLLFILRPLRVQAFVISHLGCGLPVFSLFCSSVPRAPLLFPLLSMVLHHPHCILN